MQHPWVLAPKRRCNAASNSWACLGRPETKVEDAAPDVAGHLPPQILHFSSESKSNFASMMAKAPRKADVSALSHRKQCTHLRPTEPMSACRKKNEKYRR